MEFHKSICTLCAATENNQFNINDLDDDSLGMIFNKLPFIDRMRIENVCQRWCDISEGTWYSYSKCLTISKDLLPSYPYEKEVL